MRTIIASSLICVSIWAFADSLKILAGDRKTGVYVTQDRNNYYIRTSEGAMEIVNIRRVDASSVVIAPEDERKPILEAWKRNQKPEPAEVLVPETEIPQDVAFKVVTVRRPYDPEVYAQHDRFMGQIAARDAAIRENKARIAEAQARELEVAAAEARVQAAVAQSAAREQANKASFYRMAQGITGGYNMLPWVQMWEHKDRPDLQALDAQRNIADSLEGINRELSSGNRYVPTGRW